MAYNGSGVFVRLYNFVNDAAANIKIRADRMDNELAGIATGLTTAITKDGQTTITADLPMNSHKHTGVGDAVNLTDYASYSQLRKIRLYQATVGGTADVITTTNSPALAAYVTGMEISWIASGANTTNVTINVDGLGAKAVTRDGTIALVAGDIPSGAMVTAAYDGTRLQLVNVAIPKGTIGQIFTSNGAGIAPTFQTLSSGTVLLGTLTASSSSTLNATSFITSAYDHYKIVFIDLLLSTTASVLLLGAHDNATFTDTGIAQIASLTLGGNTAPTYTGDSGSSGVTIVPSGVSPVLGGNADLTVFTRNALWHSSISAPYFSGYPRIADVAFDSGGSNKLNAFQLKPSAGNFTSGKVQIWGLKNT